MPTICCTTPMVKQGSSSLITIPVHLLPLGRGRSLVAAQLLELFEQPALFVAQLLGEHDLDAGVEVAFPAAAKVRHALPCQPEDATVLRLRRHAERAPPAQRLQDRKSTRLNSSH